MEFLEKYVIYWGKSLTKFDHEKLKKARILSGTKVFLGDIGLPKIPGFSDICFIPYSDQLAKSSFQISSKVNNCFVLGNTTFADRGSHRICLTESTEEILKINIKENIPVAFVNSSIETFAKSLTLFSEFYDAAKMIVDSEIPDNLIGQGIKEELKYLESEINRIDPKSLIIENSHWNEKLVGIHIFYGDFLISVD